VFVLLAGLALCGLLASLALRRPAR